MLVFSILLPINPLIPTEIVKVQCFHNVLSAKVKKYFLLSKMSKPTLRPIKWVLHTGLVRRFEFANDPKSYISGSVATGRASHAGKVEV